MRPNKNKHRLLALGTVILGLVGLFAVRAFIERKRPGGEQETRATLAPERREETPALEAALSLGKLHSGKKEWAKAEDAFTDAIRLNSKCAEAYHRRGGTRFNAGKAKESLSDFDAAARLDPKNADICKHRGIAYLNLLRFEEALADLRHALDLDPDHPESYRKVLGQTYASRAYYPGKKVSHLC